MEVPSGLQGTNIGDTVYSRYFPAVPLAGGINEVTELETVTVRQHSAVGKLYGLPYHTVQP